MYRFFDVAFSSSFEFPCLARTSRAGDFTLLESPVPLVLEERAESVFTWELEPGIAWLEVTRNGPEYHLNFPGYAQFLIAADAKRVTCYPVNGTPWPTLEHLILDQVLPLVLSLFGECVLHCSSVVLPAGAVAFCGKSGQGKSTLAFSMALEGGSLMTDDCLLLRPSDGQMIGVPSYPSLRLWPEDTTGLETLGLEVSEVAHYTSKKRIRIGSGTISVAESPARVAALYALSTRPSDDSDRDIAIKQLSAHEAFMELVQTSFQLDITNPIWLKGHSERLAKIANSVPMFRLSYPHNRSLLPKVVETVLKHADTLRDMLVPSQAAIAS